MLGKLNVMNLQLFRALVNILGEKEIFSKDEYDKVRESMRDENTLEDTLKALEKILSDLRGVGVEVDDLRS